MDEARDGSAINPVIVIYVRIFEDVGLPFKPILLNSA